MTQILVVYIVTVSITDKLTHQLKSVIRSTNLYVYTLLVTYCSIFLSSMYLFHMFTPSDLLMYVYVCVCVCVCVYFSEVSCVKKFALMSGICHSGSLHSGHYTAFARDDVCGSWLHLKAHNHLLAKFLICQFTLPIEHI